MGVPALFRWLANKYPKITTNVIEEQPKEIEGVKVPIDITQPNPNKAENDYLYLDMNNIIHPCAKPEGKPPPTSEAEIMIEIFGYIERIVNMVRPRKLLYMAIDGVAPRAKMNQQRSRRFRTAQEAKEKAASEEAAWEELTPELQAKRPDHDNETKFDSNCITPGTPFMVELGKALRYWVAKKLNEDPGWMGLKVILSDGSVPGEGEHKMMNFIRAQRSAPHHNPNTSHVIYGLDADLIMLALGTHEPYFRVLREDVFFQEGSSKNKCFLCNQTGHMAAQCQGKAKVKSGEFDEKAPPATQKPYIFLNVSILREYLEVELKVEGLPFEWDLERAVDDWVFLCFFVGNDFLPHLPSLETREGAIDILIEIWKRVLPLMGGFMTCNGDVDLKRAQYLMTELGKKEDGIFQERREKEERKMKNTKRRRLEDEAREAYANKEGGANLSQGNKNKPPQPDWNLPALAVRNLSEKATMGKEVAAQNKIALEQRLKNRQQLPSNQAAAALLKAELGGKGDSEKKEGESADKKDGEETTEEANDAVDTAVSIEVDAESKDDKEPSDVVMEAAANPLKRTAEELDAEESVADDDDDETEAAATPTPMPAKKVVDPDAEPDDNVRLWEPEYKERYYRNKFHIELSDAPARKEIVRCYIEGCIWVMKYYMQGCPSWQWYYPYHYSPFASDFVDIGDIEIKFELGEPFHPIEQLMGVLPAGSKQHIPEAFQGLMYKEDSPIIDLYPENFELDLNGKKFAWQGVALLPFLDPKRLLDAMGPYYKDLTEDEVERNKFGKELLFVGEKHKLYDFLCDKVYSSRGDGDAATELEYKKSGRLLGTVVADPSCVPRSTFSSPLTEQGLEDIPVDTSVSVIYSNPKAAEGFVHPSVMLKGVSPPTRVLSPDDIQWIKNGGGSQNSGRGGRGGFRGSGYRGGRGGHNNGGRGQSNGHGGNYGYERNGRGGSSYRGGRGGGTMSDNRGAADRTYPGQSFERSYPPQQNGGGYRGNNDNRGGQGGYNDGSRFPPSQRQDPYQGYDSRRGHVGYGGPPRGGGRGGYGMDNRGDRGDRPDRGDRGGYSGRGGSSRGGYGGQEQSYGGGRDYQQGGGRSDYGGSSRGSYGGSRGDYGGSSRGDHGGNKGSRSSYGGHSSSQGYGAAPAYGSTPSGSYGSGAGSYGGGNPGGYGSGSSGYGGAPPAAVGGYGRTGPPPVAAPGYASAGGRYPQEAAPMIPGFAPVNAYPAQPAMPMYGAPQVPPQVGGGYPGAVAPVPQQQGWYGQPAAAAPAQPMYGVPQPGAAPYGNLPPFPYPQHRK